MHHPPPPSLRLLALAALAVLAVPLLAGPAQAQSSGLSFAPTSQEATAAPGGRAGFTFILENRGGNETTADLEHSDAPDGMRLTLSETTVTIPAGGSENVTLDADLSSDAQPGTYNLTVTAHSRSNIKDEAVARAKLVVEEAEQSAQPDLSVTDLAFTSDPQAGDRVNVTATVTNVGETASGRFDLSFTWDGDPLATTSVDGLDSGESTEITAGHIAESGDHTVRVEVDPDDGLTEADETNNSRERAVHVDPNPHQAGLTPARSSVEAEPGETVEVDLELTYDGNRSRWFTHDATRPGPSWTVAVDPLNVTAGPDEAATVTLQAAVPDDAERGTQHTITVTAESPAATAEATVDVEIPENGTKASVTVTAPEPQPSDPTTGDSIEATATVRNAASTSARGLAVEVLVSGVVEGSAQLDVLQPDASTRVRAGPVHLPAGQHRLTAVLSDGSGEELDRASRTITVDPSEGNLSLDVEPEEASVPAGGSFGLEAIGSNHGTQSLRAQLTLEGAPVLELPEPHTLELAPGQDEGAGLSVGLAADVEPGRRLVVELTLAPDSGGPSVHRSVTVNVVAETPLELTIEGASDPLEPGTTRTYRVHVTNPTDAARSTTLRLTGLPDGWTSQALTRDVDLDPGGNETVHLTLEVPAGAELPDQLELQVTADDGTPAETSSSVVVQAASQADGGAGRAVWLAAGGVLAAGSVGAWLHEPSRWRIVGVFAPLYTRLKKDEVLDNDLRRRIYDHLRTEPGDHYSGIKSELGLGSGTLTHHLRVLEDQGLVTSRRDGRLKRFFPTDQEPPEGLLGIRGQLLETLDENPAASQSELAERLGTSRQRVHYHIQELEDQGRVRVERGGRSTRCYKTTRFQVADG